MSLPQLTDIKQISPYKQSLQQQQQRTNKVDHLPTI